MSFIQGCGGIAQQQRKFGLNLTLERDGWLYEAMADVSRHDQAIKTAFSNMRVSGLRRDSSTFSQVRGNREEVNLYAWLQDVFFR